MDTSTIVAIVVVAAVVLVVLALAMMLMKRRKNADLESRYGTEYRREVKMRGRRKAETELTQREARVSNYEIRSLAPDERMQFTDRWTRVQAEFVDAPRTALQHADVLLQEVMTARGYPMTDFDQRAADLSVEYGDVVRNYRAAQSISQNAGSGSTSTEDLRRALLLYRTMFENLLKVDVSPVDDDADEDVVVTSEKEIAV